MEAGIDAVANAESLSKSLRNVSLDDGKVFVQDGDYVIDDESSLPFECKKVLGKGWSAVVEKVECLRSKEIFANKVITFPRRGKDREQAEERYRNEVAIIRSLKSHRHIVELFATYTIVTTPRSGGLLLRPAADQGDLQYFLDQYSDAAENLATRAADLKQMDEVLERAFGCLSSGLSYMHKRGVRHKDIKPGNILIHKGVVIYTDFGASKDTKTDGKCTTEGRPEFLTRRYCAPEVLEHDKRNFAADVFSLGCVFVEILLRLSRLTEYDDLEGDGYSGILDALHALLPSKKIPSKLSFLMNIVLSMTARDPLARPPSEEVATGICYHAGFSCSHCARVPEWDAQFARYLLTLWDSTYGRYYRKHYVEDEGWVFFDWIPQDVHTNSGVTITPSGADSAGYGVRYDDNRVATGTTIQGSYNPLNPQPSSYYELLDPSFFVRGNSFFGEGKVFTVLFTETAGAGNANGLNPTDYNTSLSRVKYNEYVHTQVRTFVVTRCKREFCFAVPIFTYGNKGTTKRGIVADEHAIAYSLGTQPQLVPGELPLAKAPIPIVMDNDAGFLSPASRIYFAIHHPIQYNVKVKSIGYVHPDYLPTFLGYWNQEIFGFKQNPEVTQNRNDVYGILCATPWRWIASYDLR